MSHRIEITVGDVNDVEARVYARLATEAGAPLEPGDVVLAGTLRGPFCATARTLPAEFLFRPVPGKRFLVEAFVPDPCVWSEELPHLYEANIEARQDGQVIAEFHGTIGLRKSNP